MRALAPSTPMGLLLTNALPNSSSTLVIGLVGILLPFKGGVLVPNPDVLELPDVGHYPQVEAPVPVLEAVLDQFARPRA